MIYHAFPFKLIFEAYTFAYFAYYLTIVIVAPQTNF